MYTVRTQLDMFKPLPTKVTKLDALIAKRKALQEALDRAIKDLEALDNPCYAHPCSCGEEFVTEHDFAGHFYIKRMDLLNDNLNLGWCPVEDGVK